MNNGHRPTHGSTTAIWDKICHDFHQEAVMKGKASVKPSTLKKKFESMLEDDKLLYNPCDDEDDADMDDESILRNRLFEIKTEIAEMKERVAKDKEEKAAFKAELEHISKETISKSMKTTTSNKRSHGVITLTEEESIMATPAKTPKKPTLDELIENMLTPILNSSSTSSSLAISMVNKASLARVRNSLTVSSSKDSISSISWMGT